MKRPSAIAALACASLFGLSRPARADFIITPFVGTTFAAETTIQTVETGVDAKKWIVGASGAWLSAGVLGVEADFSYTPRFFDSGLLLNRSGSNVTTLTGSVIVAVPLSVTRESLRPYLTGGLGMLHAGVDDQLSFRPVDRNQLAVSVGGGAIGFFNSRTGVRFDLRHIRSASSGVDTSGTREPRLGFWRATIGVAIRY